jgi:hypothetical protein
MMTFVRQALLVALVGLLLTVDTSDARTFLASEHADTAYVCTAPVRTGTWLNQFGTSTVHVPSLQPSHLLSTCTLVNDLLSIALIGGVPCEVTVTADSAASPSPASSVTPVTSLKSLWQVRDSLFALQH